MLAVREDAGEERLATESAIDIIRLTYQLSPATIPEFTEFSSPTSCHVAELPSLTRPNKLFWAMTGAALACPAQTSEHLIPNVDFVLILTKG
jgi:hypothetical protein